MLSGSSIAAILTGILALVGAVATAWMSSWNEERVQVRTNRKALARYSVPLLIAAWDLANWFYDILEENNYSPQRCKAYGGGWNGKFTSYLLGQYFAGVHIIREMTQFFAHLDDERAVMLKRLLWKIQDEFVSMNYEGRESLEMRWFEGDILAAQEVMTEKTDLDGDGNAGELRTMGYVEFRQNYEKDRTAAKSETKSESKSEGKPEGKSESKPADDESFDLKALFEPYEVEFQRIIYRRFKQLYSTKWRGQTNPQDFETMKESAVDEKARKIVVEEEDRIKTEQQEDPAAGVVVPDWRVRRLQHLLSDLVESLDEVSAMKFNRPIRRCGMLVKSNPLASKESVRVGNDIRVPCDCYSVHCNPQQEDFAHRQLEARGRRGGLSKVNPFRQANPTPDRSDVVRGKTAEKDSGSLA